MRFTIEKKGKRWALYYLTDDNPRELIGTYLTERGAELAMTIRFDRGFV